MMSDPDANHVELLGCTPRMRRWVLGMEAEVERLRASHIHCDHCGGSWLDDGINPRCRCQEIKRLRNLYREARRRVYCFDPTSYKRLGEEEFDAETEHHLDEAAEAAGGE